MALSSLRPQGSRRRPKMPYDSAAWKPSLRAVKQRTALSLRNARLSPGRKVARTEPAPGGPAGRPSGGAHYPCLQGRRCESGSGKDLSQDLREQAFFFSSAPQSRAKAVEPSEPIPFGGRSKDRRDYSPRLVTVLDQIHDQGIELFLAGATERPYCSLELLLRDVVVGAAALPETFADQRASLMGESVQGTADPRGALRGPGQVFLEVFLHTLGNGTFPSGISAGNAAQRRAKCRSGPKKRGGRGRDRGHSKSEAAPKRGRGRRRGAAGLVAGVIAVSMVPQSGGPGSRAPPL